MNTHFSFRNRSRFLTLALLLCFSSVAFSDETETNGPKHYYLLSNPVSMSADLGLGWRVAHFTFETGYRGLRTLLLAHATGHTFGAFPALFSAELPTLFPMIAGQSLAHLQLKATNKVVEQLQPLFKATDAKLLHIISTRDELKFKWGVASSMKAKFYIILETSKPLDENIALDAKWNPAWGQPIPVSGSQPTPLKFKFFLAGKEQPVIWESSVEELLKGTAPPQAVVQDWRNYYRADKASEVRAFLVGKDGKERQMGTLMQRREISKLLGLGIVPKILAYASGHSETKAKPVRIIRHSTDSTHGVYGRCRVLFDQLAELL